MLSEQLLEEIQEGHGETLAIAARRIPSTRQGKTVTLSCLLRWVLNGVTGPDGQQIYLEAGRLAGKWVTSPGAIRRFIEAQTPANSQSIPVARSLANRRRASEQAAEALRSIGI